MDALVVFDSTSGNTEKIAKAVAAGIGGRTKAVRAGTAEARGLDKVELLVLGTPVLGDRASPRMQAFMKSIPQGASKKLKIATFDTRMSGFAKLFGSAAVRMAKQLEGMGFTAQSKPEGFIVTTRTGPLAEGELDRATSWGKELSESR